MEYSVINGSKELWNKNASDFEKGESYDTLVADNVYADVKKGDKIYFVLKPRQWSLRAEQATMWDPQVDYISESVFGNANYSSGVVTIETEKFENTFGNNAKLIAAAFSADDILIGASVCEVSSISANSTISISGLNEKPASVKLFVWNFGENGEELIPLFGVIEKTVVD